MGLRGRAGALVLVLLLGIPGCAGKKKQDASTTPSGPRGDAALETYQRGMEYLTKRNLRQARAQLEQIEYQPGYEKRGQIEPLARLALADATFYQNNSIAFIDARNLYLDFVTLYGNHPLAPYAQTQVGLCSLKQVNHPTRDQSQTLQAIADLDEVLLRFPDSSFVIAARGLRRVARSRIAEAEYRVAKFYMKRKAWSAAIERFKLITNGFPDFLDMEKVHFHLGKALVLGGDSVEGRLILDRLVAENPEGRYAKQAQKLIDAAGGAFRDKGEPAGDGSAKGG